MSAEPELQPLLQSPSNVPLLGMGEWENQQFFEEGYLYRSPTYNFETAQARADVALAVEANWRKKMTAKLIFGIIFCLACVVAEVAGGLIANSLAVITDAIHLLSDVSSCAISLAAVQSSANLYSRRLAASYHRTQVIGAILSILSTWLLTFLLMIFAVGRIVDIVKAPRGKPPFHVNGKLMLFVALASIVVNFIKALVVGGGQPESDEIVDNGDYEEEMQQQQQQQHTHSHSGPGGHSHSHGNAGGGHSHSHGSSGGHSHSHGAPKVQEVDDQEDDAEQVSPRSLEAGNTGTIQEPVSFHGSEESGRSHSRSDPPRLDELYPPQLSASSRSAHSHSHGTGGVGGHSHSHGAGGVASGGHSHSHGAGAVEQEPYQSYQGGYGGDDYAHAELATASTSYIKAALLQIIGDFIQSLGVMLGACIIWIHPSWIIADPICTLVFGSLVIISQITVLKDNFSALMDSASVGQDLDSMEELIRGVDGVVDVTDLHIWSMTPTTAALAVHIQAAPSMEGRYNELIRNVHQVVFARFKLQHCTVQVEPCDPQTPRSGGVYGEY